MKVFKVAFEFCVGLLAVIMILMAVIMIAYVMKVTLIEIFGGDPIQKIKEWWKNAR